MVVNAVRTGEGGAYEGLAAQDRPFIGSTKRAGRWVYDWFSLSLIERGTPPGVKEAIEIGERATRASKWADRKSVV